MSVLGLCASGPIRRSTVRLSADKSAERENVIRIGLPSGIASPATIRAGSGAAGGVLEEVLPDAPRWCPTHGSPRSVSWELAVTSGRAFTRNVCAVES